MDDPATNSPEILIEWMEHGGPEAVEPQSKGFGTFITQRAVALETQGVVDTNYDATGFAWKLRFPLEDAPEGRT